MNRNHYLGGCHWGIFIVIAVAFVVSTQRHWGRDSVAAVALETTCHGQDLNAKVLISAETYGVLGRDVVKTMIFFSEASSKQLNTFKRSGLGVELVNRKGAMRLVFGEYHRSVDIFISLTENHGKQNSSVFCRRTQRALWVYEDDFCSFWSWAFPVSSPLPCGVFEDRKALRGKSMYFLIYSCLYFHEETS